MSALTRCIAYLSLALLSAAASAQLLDGDKDSAAVCKSLLKEGKCSDARKLCETWLLDKDSKRVAEGHKCLANVVLCDQGTMIIQAGDTGGGYIGDSYQPAAVDEALEHLNKALQLAPQDLSIHQGRLHLLSVAGRFQAMPKALEESMSTYKGGTVETWIGYSYELFEAEQYRSAIQLLKILERSFPDDHQVIGNLGAFHSLLKEDEKALPYLVRAVELAPNDPIDTWNLGRAYDYMGKNELADKWYTRSLALDDDAERRNQSWCVYAEFIQKKLKDSKRACEIQKEHACTQVTCE